MTCLHPSPHRWDPDRYLAYADERGRPFVDLLARVDAEAPADVVDLGCGPGNLTRLLAERWPDARVRGLDSSPEMVERRAGATSPDVDFEVADLRDWAGSGGARPTSSSATRPCSGCPTTSTCCPALADRVRPGGWLAFQVPGNFDEPSHTIRTELAARPPYDAHTRDVAVPASHDPEDYLAVLAGCGLEVDVWETTYLHVLTGEDPVFTWVSGTGARPTLQALPADLRADFERGVPRAAARGLPGPRPRRGAAVPPDLRGRPAAGRPMRLHHVQLAIPAGGEPEARRFWVDGVGLPEVDKPEPLRGRGGLWLRLGRRSRSTSASRSRSARRARPTPRCCSTTVATLDATAARLEALGYDVDRRERDTFPGHVRVHVSDGHGNRVELLLRRRR